MSSYASDYVFFCVVGPLLYHYSDMPNEMSIELSYDEVRRVIEQTGFVFEVSLTDILNMVK